MSDEKQGAGAGANFSRFLSALFGLSSVAEVVCAAVFGYADPLFGAGLFAAGVVSAVLALILGLIFDSIVARRLACVALVAAVAVFIAGTLALFSNKAFEDRCVAAWECILRVSDDIERNAERLEERFDDQLEERFDRD